MATETNIKSTGEEEQVFEYHPNINIRVVLNGGQSTLDTATVPLQWHFSNDLIAKKPQFIVICDHLGSIENLSDSNYYSFGTRHIIEVKKLASYIQLHCSGRHHFVIMVFYGDKKDALERAHKYMKKDGSAYGKSLFVSSILKNNKDEDTYSCEMTIVEFDVPLGLFSERPKSKFGQAIWEWVNRWYSTDPIDQCDYRRRKIFAFTIQLILFLIGRAIAGLFITLYSIIGAAVLWFIGWKSISVLPNIVSAWKKIDKAESDLRKYGSCRMYQSYRDAPDKVSKFIPKWRVPIFLIFDVVCVVAFVNLIMSLTLDYGIVFLIILGALVLFVLLSTIAVNFFSTPERKARRLKRKESAVEQQEVRKMRVEKNKVEIKEEKYINFLRQNTTLSLAPTKVDVAVVIKRVNPVTKFILGYWATKAKVCKPFAK